MAKVTLDIEGKDSTSAAFQSARDRLVELRREIDALRAKGPLELTKVDTTNLRALTSEANQIERAMRAVSGSATAGLGGISGMAEQAVPGVRNLAGAFGNLSGVLDTFGLGGIGTLLGGAGIAAAVAGIGKVALSLEAMREESTQVEARFVGFTGSTQAANAAMQAFDNTLGNALSKDEKMAAATKLLGLGLADSAQDAANMTQQALTLGISIETLTQALETGRTTGLVQYGISTTEVKKRAEELQKANADLTTEEAKAIAIKEQLAVKSQMVAEAGGQAATSIEQLQNAWDTLKDTAADKVQLEVAIKGGTNVLNTITDWISGKGQQKAKVEIGEGEITRQMNRITQAQSEMAQLGPEAYNTDLVNAYKAEIADATDKLNAAYVALAYVKTNSDESGASMLQLGSNAAYAAAQIASVASAAEGVSQAAINATNNRWAGLGGYYTSVADTERAANMAGRNADINRWAGLGQQYVDAQTAAAKEAATANARAARSAASSWDSEFNKVSSRIQGYLSNGINAAIGLKDYRQDIFKPGSNGPFENIFRAMAIANNGADTAQEQMWAQQLGLTPATAAKIAADFQRGIFSPEVMGVINVDQLVNEAQMADLAEKSQAAFVNAIAKKAGVKTNLVSSMFGLGGSGEGGGKGGGTGAEKQVAQAMDQVATSIGSTVAGKDFAGKMVGYGTTMWVSMEKGFVDTAKKSNALQEAIDGMVANALLRGGMSSGKSGSGATSAARSQGVVG